MATWFKTDGTSQKVKPARGKKFSLSELQKYVGGYIELTKTREKPARRMYINEEGQLYNLPMNMQATFLIHPSYMVLDGIRGDAIVMDKGEG